MAKTPLFSHPFFITLAERPFPLGVSFDDEARKRGLLNGLSLVGIVFLILLGSLAYMQGGLLLATIDFLVAGLLVCLLFLLWFKGCLNLCINYSIGLIFFLFIYLFINGGMAGNAFLWSFTFPLLTFFLLGTKKGLLVSVVYYSFCLIVILLDLNTSLFNDLYSKVFALRFLPSFAVIIILSFIYEFFRETSQKALIKLNDQLEQEVIKRTAELQQEVKEKTKAQQAAMIAKEEWERTFDAVPDEIIILDKDHRIVRANKAMVESINLSQEEFVGAKCHKIVHGKEAPPSYCPHSKLLDTHKLHYLDFFDDYKQRYLSVTVSPFYDGQGVFLGSVRVARDITEQKNAQIERDNTKEQLRKAEKMEAIGLLAGGVAHDLNNILSGVVSYPEMLLHQLPKQDEFYEHIKFIHDSGKRAAAVVADLLTVARGVATVREVRSLNALIIDYLGSIEFKNIQSLYPQVDLISKLEADLWNIRCSPVHIQKMLMNLITNGIEAIDGKGSVHVSTVNTIIQPDNRVPSIPAGEYVVLTVHDTGTGIAKHDLEKIFEPFYTKKVMGRSGTGLGLAVVWNIVTDHGANIDVNSDSSGTTFIIHFPASSKEKVVSEKNIDITSLNGTGSILIVDDEQDQQRIASQMLGSLGYSTTSVSSGEEAVKFFQDNSADLVILDMVMEPRMNGHKTYKEIIKIVPDQKAIIASGFSESDDVKAALKLGVGSYIKKPYSMAQLGQVVKIELSKK